VSLAPEAIPAVAVGLSFSASAVPSSAVTGEFLSLTRGTHPRELLVDDQLFRFHDAGCAAPTSIRMNGSAATCTRGPPLRGYVNSLLESRDIYLKSVRDSLTSSLVRCLGPATPHHDHAIGSVDLRKAFVRAFELGWIRSELVGGHSLIKSIRRCLTSALVADSSEAKHCDRLRKLVNLWGQRCLSSWLGNQLVELRKLGEVGNDTFGCFGLRDIEPRRDRIHVFCEQASDRDDGGNAE
jgi:hypothetical protein